MRYKLFALFTLIALALSACAPSASAPVATPNANAQKLLGSGPSNAQAGANAQPTAAPSNGTAVYGGVLIVPNSLGVTPQPGENVDPNIYKKPYESGTITNDQGNAVYTQSSKPKWADLHGKVPSGCYVQIDAYTVKQNGIQTGTKGNLIVVAGPANLDDAKISYLDGSANLVCGNVQAFLDDNVYGKFCRGDFVNGAFSYKPWALDPKNIQLPAGITFKSLADCPKDAAHDTTTIPDMNP